MKHKKVRENLPLFFLGELNRGSKKKIESHLVQCPSCREEFNFITMMTQEIRKSRVPAINSLALEKVKKLAIEKLFHKERVQEEKIRNRLLVFTSFISLCFSLASSLLGYLILSPVIPWAVFNNFACFLVLWGGIFTFFSLVSLPIALQLKNIHWKEVTNENK